MGWTLLYGYKIYIYEKSQGYIIFEKAISGEEKLVL